MADETPKPIADESTDIEPTTIIPAGFDQEITIYLNSHTGATQLACKIRMDSRLILGVLLEHAVVLQRTIIQKSGVMNRLKRMVQPIKGTM